MTVNPACSIALAGELKSEEKVEIQASVKMGSIASRTTTILAALLFATMMTGCYDVGSWEGGGFGGWGGGGGGYYGGNTYYSNNGANAPGGRTKLYR